MVQTGAEEISEKAQRFLCPVCNLAITKASTLKFDLSLLADTQT